MSDWACNWTPSAELATTAETLALRAASTADLLSDEICGACLDPAGEECCWERVLFGSRKIPLSKIRCRS